MFSKAVPLVWLTVVACHGEVTQSPHPRIWVTEAREKAIRQKLEADPLAAQLHQISIHKADEIIDLPTCKYDIPDGRRLLRQSRLAFTQTLNSAWAWRFTGDEKYLKRTIKELEAACSLKDWNPSHFLDTAEMAAAVALGYDWLYESLTPEQRKMCEQAIITKALIPAKIRFDREEWWTDARNNWAQVCGAGIGIAAIAIANHDQNLSNELLPQCISLVERCKRFYEPDGMYPEGPGYWQYGTHYHIMLLDACKVAGQPIEIPTTLNKSGNSLIHLTGPTLLPFNFSDGKARTSTPSPAQGWIASHFKNTSQASVIRERLSKAITADETTLKLAPLSLLWLPPQPENPTRLPTHAFYDGEQSVAIFRTDWSKEAAWLAIKGGTPEGGHGHMDVGTFCYDAHGMRWIHDLGADDYNMPGYFRDQRFTYYRLQNRSHNTLEIDGKLQDPDSKPCPIIERTSKNETAAATFDLTHAYADSVKKITRTAEFHRSSGISRLQDEIIQPSGDVVWRAFTKAECEIRNNEVILTQKGKSIRIQRLSSAGTWTIEDAEPPLDIEDPNEGYRAITLTIPKENRISIDIEIRP